MGVGGGGGGGCPPFISEGTGVTMKVPGSVTIVVQEGLYH
jgi:hypothetical protein